MKKIVSHIVSLVMIIMLMIGISINVVAVEACPTLEEQYVITYMEHVFGVEVNVTKQNYMYDLYGKEKYLYCELSIEKDYGYAVLNVDTFELPECALDHTPPIDFTEAIVYAGPLTYLLIYGDTYYDAISGISINVGESFYARQTQEQGEILTQDQKMQKIQDTRASESVIKMITGANNTWLYSAGNIVGDCGINCVAMLEKYYDSNVNTNYLPSSMETEEQIKMSIYNWCANNGMPTESIGETLLADIISRHTMSVGQKGYYLYAQASPYNWKTAVSSVIANRALAISIKNHPLFQYHYVIVCGYADTGDPNTSRLYINSGWTSEGYVWIDQSYGYYEISCV